MSVQATQRNLDVQLANLPKQVEQERNRLLEPTRKELEDLGLEISSKKAELKRLIKDGQKAVDDKQTATTALQDDIATLIEVVDDKTLTNKALTDKKEMLEGQLEVLNAKVVAQASTSAVFKDTTAKLREEMALLVTRNTLLNDEGKRLQAQHQSLMNTMAAAQADLEKKLRTINYKLSESIKKLQETQGVDEQMRSELASRKVELDRREEVLTDRENRLKAKEKQVYDYARAIDL